MRLGTLNVGPVSSKGRELVDMMARCCVFRRQGWKGGGFKLFYDGVDRKKNGVVAILNQDYVNSVEVERAPDRV